MIPSPQLSATERLPTNYEEQAKPTRVETEPKPAPLTGLTVLQMTSESGKSSSLPASRPTKRVKKEGASNLKGSLSASASPGPEEGKVTTMGGSSCHQCKSRRNSQDLTYCTSNLRKKSKGSQCRKKYCDHCLNKFYPEFLPAMNKSQGWKCPSCRNLCCCAACRRRESKLQDLNGKSPQGPRAYKSPKLQPSGGSNKSNGAGPGGHYRQRSHSFSHSLSAEPRTSIEQLLALSTLAREELELGASGGTDYDTYDGSPHGSLGGSKSSRSSRKRELSPSSFSSLSNLSTLASESPRLSAQRPPSVPNSLRLNARSTSGAASPALCSLSAAAAVMQAATTTTNANLTATISTSNAAAATTTAAASITTSFSTLGPTNLLKSTNNFNSGKPANSILSITPANSINSVTSATFTNSTIAPMTTTLATGTEKSLSSTSLQEYDFRSSPLVSAALSHLSIIGNGSMSPMVPPRGDPDDVLALMAKTTAGAMFQLNTNQSVPPSARQNIVHDTVSNLAEVARLPHVQDTVAAIVSKKHNSPWDQVEEIANALTEAVDSRHQATPTSVC